MSDDTQVEAKLTSETLSSFGEKLKSTRENMGLTIQDAALRLHLSPRFIDLLENENLLQSTLPPIYLRGYLRSYARLLNIPASEVAAVLEKLAPTPAILTAASPSAESLALSFPLQDSPQFTRLATFFVALILLSSLSTWWYLHSNNSFGTTLAANQPLNENQSPELVQVALNNLPPVNEMPSTSTETSPNSPEAAKTMPASPAAPSNAAATPQPALTPGKHAEVAAATPTPTTVKSVAKPSEPDEGDESADEQD